MPLLCRSAYRKCGHIYQFAYWAVDTALPGTMAFTVRGAVPPVARSSAAPSLRQEDFIDLFLKSNKLAVMIRFRELSSDSLNILLYILMH